MEVDIETAVPGLIADVVTGPVAIRRRILVVDDVPANLLALEVALAPLDREIAIANSGREALAHLLASDFLLVLIDVQMPGMDGFETAELIRSRERSRHIPIIFLTAHHGDPSAVRRAYRLGAVDFMFKPFEPEILLAKASVFVTLEERNEQLASERTQRELEQYETMALRRQMAQEQTANARLAEFNEALAENNRRKDSFLAILGHELRNPLAPIRTAIDLAKAEPARGLDRKLVDIIDRQAVMLTRLVEDLLDMSRINSNKIELRPEPVQLGDIIEVAVSTSRPAIDARQHTLVVSQDAQSVQVVGDHMRLVQVVTNVLNNAARYTPPGGEIRIACECDRDRAYIRISDNGIGIPGDLLPSIFEMFVQERVRSDGSGGLGLGLALARQLVEMHRGHLRASSGGRDCGSTFEIELPVQQSSDALASRPRSGAMQPLERSTARPSLRVVLIDDNLDAIELLAELLTCHGHSVMTAHDGPQGLALILEHPPDVALIDLGLPGMDGLTLARELRSGNHDIKTRLVALTGYGHPRDVQRTKEAGFDAHVVKPASMTAILECLTATPPTSPGGAERL